MDQEKIIKPILAGSDVFRLLLIALALSLILGSVTGYILGTKKSGTKSSLILTNNEKPKVAQQDSRTFRDFAEGTIKPKKQPANPTEYTEGTHTLERDGAYPVALTSSVVDLSTYENKKVKVYGETQKALKEGWLMDVGKVEVIQ